MWDPASGQELAKCQLTHPPETPSEGVDPQEGVSAGDGSGVEGSGRGAEAGLEDKEGSEKGSEEGGDSMDEGEDADQGAKKKGPEPPAILCLAVSPDG